MTVIAMLTAFFTSTAEFFKSVNMFLPDILAMIHARQALDAARLKRETDAMKAQVDSQLQAAKNQARKESANLRAYQATLNAAWKQVHLQILTYLDAGDDYSVLQMVGVVDDTRVDAILFDDIVSSNAAKAMKICKIMQETGNGTES